MTELHIHLIDRVCNKVLDICAALGLPDDNLMQCIASIQVLNKKGLDASLQISRLDLSDSNWCGLEFVTIKVLDEQYDMSGRSGSWEEICQRRLNYLVDHYGLLVEEDETADAAEDVAYKEYLATRWPGFFEQCDTVANLALARIDDPTLPPPAALLNRPLHGGPLLSARYDTQARKLKEQGDCVGLSNLLSTWQSDSDTARSATFPQQLLRLVATVRITPQNTALEDEIVSMVKRPRQAGADISHMRYPGDSLLIDAICARNGTLARYLIDDGLPLNTESTAISGTRSPLVCAIDDEQVELAHHLLDKGASAVSEPRGEKSALATAVSGGHFALAKRLLAQGADPLFELPQKSNLLHHLLGAKCSKQDKIVMALQLLGHGVSPYETNWQGASPLEMARKQGEQELEALFLNWAANQIERSTLESAGERPRNRL